MILGDNSTSLNKLPYDVATTGYVWFCYFVFNKSISREKAMSCAIKMCDGWRIVSNKEDFCPIFEFWYWSHKNLFSYQ